VSDLEREMCTVGFKHNWRKTEAAAQDGTGWRQVVWDLCSTGNDRHKSRQLPLGRRFQDARLIRWSNSRK